MTSWHVIGAGSLGVLWAFHLRQAGHDVTLWMRSAGAVERFKAGGSRVHIHELWRGSPTPAWVASEPLQAVAVPSDPQLPQRYPVPVHTRSHWPDHQISRLVVATKAHDTVAAIRSILPHMAPGCRCILLQNGVLGVADELKRELGVQLGLTFPSIMPVRNNRGGPGSSAPVASVGGAGTPAHGSCNRTVRLYVASVTHGCYRAAPPPGTAAAALQGEPSSNVDGASAAQYGVVHAGLGGITIGPLGPLLGPAEAVGASSAPSIASDPNDTGALPSQPCTGSSVASSSGAAPTTGRGATDIDKLVRGISGEDSQFLQELAASLPGLAIRPAMDPSGLLQELLRKLAANCAINPLTALLGCRNGALVEARAGAEQGRGEDGMEEQAAGLSDTRGLMLQVCRELVAVFGPGAFGPPPATAATAGTAGTRGAAGRVTGEDITNLGFVAAGSNSPLDPVSEAAAQALFRWVVGVAEATGRNRSSMLQDVQAGRRTEVDYLGVWVARVARGRRLQVPVNATLCALVRAREALAREGA